MTARFLQVDIPCALFTAFLLLAFYSGPSFAHKVNMFAFVEGNQVFVEGYFSDGKRAQNSEVTVFDDQGKVLKKGKTDHEGNFSFRVPPEARSLRIALNAGMGHKTEYTLGEDELTGMLPEAQQPEEENAGASGPEETGVDSVSVDERAIRHAVGQAILPLMRRMSSLEERASFSDIIGGIGFILGVAGVFFYFKARSMMRAMGGSPGSERKDLQG
ncbi:MAG TPA: hypothetical protein ENK48_08875 [Gammaproteobacteria bacterium]|nr:hypothetical protein [Gammaproteobacteria bacterium]